MKIENEPLKESISKRMSEERIELVEFVEPKKKRRRFDIQMLIVISVLIGLIFTVLRLLSMFKTN